MEFRIQHQPETDDSSMGLFGSACKNLHLDPQQFSVQNLNLLCGLGFLFFFGGDPYRFAAFHSRHSPVAI